MVSIWDSRSNVLSLCLEDFEVDDGKVMNSAVLSSNNSWASALCGVIALRSAATSPFGVQSTIKSLQCTGLDRGFVIGSIQVAGCAEVAEKPFSVTANDKKR